MITGPSGVGKGTLIRGLLQRMPGFELAVSATTRSPRPGEVNGVDYHYLSPDEFDRRVRAGEFVEHAEYAGNRYGTLRTELNRPAQGVVLEIDLQGARQVRETLPGAVQIFIEPPCEGGEEPPAQEGDAEAHPAADERREQEMLAALEARLAGRASDSPEQVERRLAAAREELAARHEFPYRIVNDDKERATAELAELAASMCKP